MNILVPKHLSFKVDNILMFTSIKKNQYEKILSQLASRIWKHWSGSWLVYEVVTSNIKKVWVVYNYVMKKLHNIL